MKTPSKKTFNYLSDTIVAVALYVSFQIFADILAIKITSFGMFIIPTAVFIYPLTFTFRDMIHKVTGKKGARNIIIISAILNLIMVLLFQFSIWLPSAETWGLQTEYSLVLGSVWRIVLASIGAELISQLVDTEAYSFFINKITKKHQWARVLFSNFFSSPIDSFVFIFIAFYGIMPLSVLVSMVVGQTLVKWVVSAISMPLVYLVKEKEGVEM